jgi:hypothetical protein
LQAERASVAPPPRGTVGHRRGADASDAAACRIGLPEPHRIILRAALAMTIAWIPLVVLAWIGGTLAVFLRDVEIHIRLLVALPIAILAEMPADRWSRQALRHFRESGIDRAPSRAGWGKTAAGIPAACSTRHGRAHHRRPRGVLFVVSDLECGLIGECTVATRCGRCVDRRPAGGTLSCHDLSTRS